ncbi:MAG: hypothetical protein R3A11_03155 [Bdellovibrionota bacterium]
MFAVYECGVCNHKFKLDLSKIPPQGVKVTCTQCMNFFYLSGSAVTESNLDFPILEKLSGDQPQPSEETFEAIETKPTPIAPKGTEIVFDSHHEHTMDEYSSVQEDVTQDITSPSPKEELIDIPDEEEIEIDHEESIEVVSDETLESIQVDSLQERVSNAFQSRIIENDPHGRTIPSIDFTDPESAINKKKGASIPPKSSISDLISDSIGVPSPETEKKSAFTSTQAPAISYHEEIKRNALAKELEKAQERMAAKTGRVIETSDSSNTDRYRFRKDNDRGKDADRLSDSLASIKTSSGSKLEKYLVTLSLVVIAGTLVAFFMVFMKDSKTKQNDEKRLEQIILDGMNNSSPSPEEGDEEPKQKFGFQKPPEQ